MMNKNYWGKENGTQGFHYVLSFPPDAHIDEAMAYRITEEFCKELFGDSFYYCIAVHNDKPHMHAHVTFDSVSKIDGYKFHSPKGDWEKRIQPITDRICRKYGIPTLAYEKEKCRGMDYGSWRDGKESIGKRKRSDRDSRRSRKPSDKADNNYTQTENANAALENRTSIDLGTANADVSEEVAGNSEKIDEIPKFSWYDIIRDDIDDAIESSDSYEEFLAILRRQHYELRDKKYLSLKPFGKERSVRSMRLGKEYSKERIRERIGERKTGVEFRRYGDNEKLAETLREYKTKNGSPTVYQKQFYYRFVSTVNIRHPVFYDYENWKYKKDVLNLYIYSQQINYVLKNGIRSKEDAEKKRQELLGNLQKIKEEKTRLRLSLGAGSNYYRMKRLLSLQEEMKKYPVGSREDLMEQARSLIEKITLSETLDEALTRFNRVNQVLDNLERGRKRTHEELKLVEGILGEDFKNRDYRNLKSRRIRSDEEQRIRITINKKLFVDTHNKSGINIFRIPRTKACVAIPIKHIVKLSDATVVAFIHQDDNYQIMNENGKEIGTVKGEGLKKYFKIRPKYNRNIKHGSGKKQRYFD